MSNDGEYVDNVLLQGFCDTLSCQLRIVYGNEQPDSIIGAPSSIKITVGYLESIKHYVNLRYF